MHTAFQEKATDWDTKPPALSSSLTQPTHTKELKDRNWTNKTETFRVQWELHSY